MSIHSSLRSTGTGAGQRNVWTRVERIAALKKAGRWSEEDGVTGLPKVRTKFKVVTKKKKKKKKEEEEEGEAK
jgi:small basic protein (TIGR04137 family)